MLSDWEAQRLTSLGFGGVLKELPQKKEKEKNEAPLTPSVSEIVSVIANPMLPRLCIQHAADRHLDVAAKVREAVKNIRSADKLIYTENPRYRCRVDELMKRATRAVRDHIMHDHIPSLSCEFIDGKYNTDVVVKFCRSQGHLDGLVRSLLAIQREEFEIQHGSIKDFVVLDVFMTARQAGVFIGRGQHIKWFLREMEFGGTRPPHPTIMADLESLDGTRVVAIKKHIADGYTRKQLATFAQKIRAWVEENP